MSSLSSILSIIVDVSILIDLGRKILLRMSRAKSWCFTLNNWTEDDCERLRNLGDKVSYIIFGKEVGDSGTPHLQGYVKCRDRCRLSQVKRLVGQRAHCQVARHPVAALEYCKKDGDFEEFGQHEETAGSRNDLELFKADVREGMLNLKEIRENHSEVYAKYPQYCLEYIDDHTPEREVEDFPLRQWQMDLNVYLNREPEDRKIVFVVDEVGNSGKTWFAHYYRRNHEKVQVLLPGRKVDMTYALDSTIRVCFVDAPRSKQGEYLQYDFLEEMKNGYIFSSKYQSRIKTLGKIHLVVLMNEMPDMTKLSADRYHIIQVQQGTNNQAW